jgi:hypothetical protein
VLLFIWVRIDPGWKLDPAYSRQSVWKKGHSYSQLPQQALPPGAACCLTPSS